MHKKVREYQKSDGTLKKGREYDEVSKKFGSMMDYDDSNTSDKPPRVNNSQLAKVSIVL